MVEPTPLPQRRLSEEQARAIVKRAGELEPGITVAASDTGQNQWVVEIYRGGSDRADNAYHHRISQVAKEVLGHEPGKNDLLLAHQHALGEGRLPGRR